MLFSLLQPPPCICLICNKYKTLLQSSPHPKKKDKPKANPKSLLFFPSCGQHWYEELKYLKSWVSVNSKHWFSARCSLKQVCKSTVPLPMSLPSISFNITDFPFVIRIASPSHFLCFFFDALHHTTLKYFTRQSGASWAASSFAVPDVGKHSASKREIK